jgi:hypothetical protein
LFPVLSFGQDCSVFSEPFGSVAKEWQSNNVNAWELSSGTLKGTPIGGDWTYAETAFPDASDFMVDVDVSISGTGSYSIYVLNAATDLITMSDGTFIDGFAVWVNGSDVTLRGWDFLGSKWITYGSASSGGISSIGLKYTSSGVYGRINGSDVIGPVAADLSFYRPDSLWLQAQGNISVTFDNVCAGPAATTPPPPPPPTGLTAPQLNYTIANNMITLSWTSVSGASGYLLDAWQSPNSYYVNDFNAGKLTSVGPVNLNGIPPGIYNVAVTAYSASSSSPRSNVITVPVGTTADVFAPHNLRYTLNGKNIIIQWDQALKATGYKIGIGQQPGVYNQVHNVGNRQQIGPVDVTPYPPGTYYVAVKSYNQNGESSFSEEITIKNTAGVLSIGPTNVTGGATGNYTSGSGGSTVSFTVTPNANDGSVTASMSIGQQVLSVLTNSSSASITWNGVKIDGFGSLTAQERTALESLAGSGLAEALAMIPLDASCGGVELDLASAQALLLPWQLILKYTSCNPAAAARTMAERSACSYFGTIDTATRPQYILMSENDPIPYVHGSAPLDAAGALSEDPARCPDILSSVDFSSLFSYEMKALAESYATPCGSKCRGACGPDCEPRNCTKTTTYECDVNEIFMQEFEKHECGVHQGCIDHDDCYDRCDSDYDCADSWGNWGCHRKCDGECFGTYCKKCVVFGALGGFWIGGGCLAGVGCECPRWAVGLGPQPMKATFLYLKNPEYGPCQTLQCNETSQAGSDTPDTQIIELGKNSGAFSFSYQTYSIKDQIIVMYEGSVLFDTGCVGASGSPSLQYSGSSTKITVKVIPDCAGETGTAWNYTIGCP